MNERIQELAYLAEDYADSIVDQGGEFHETYTKKLAELIIQECMEQCTKVEDDDELSDFEGGFRDGAMLCREEIKSHFGVEA